MGAYAPDDDNDSGSLCMRLPEEEAEEEREMKKLQQ